MISDEAERERRVMRAFASEKNYSTLSLEEMTDFYFLSAPRFRELERALQLGESSESDECYRVFSRREWQHMSAIIEELKTLCNALGSSVCRIQQDEIPTDSGFYWTVLENKD